MTGLSTIKDYWNRRPCNINHSKAVPGTLKFYDDVAFRRYFLVESHIWNFMEPKKWANKKILEIGCGIGTDAIAFASEGGKVTAVDFSKESIKIAKASAKAMGVRIKFYEGNAEELSKFLPVEKYDLIYSYGVLHHTINPQNVINGLKKYCKKGTRFKIMLYNKWSWKGMFLWLKDKSWENSEAQPNSPLTRVYSKRKARKLLKDFKIIKMKVDFIFPYKVDKYINHEYKVVWYWPLLKHLKKYLGWHIIIEAEYV